jgi:GTP-binding protein YchF
MRIGLIGWPGSGKTSLFRALGGARHGPGGPTLLTDERGVVSVEVPDARLVWLREHFQPKKFTPARIEFVDFPGIPKGNAKGKPELLAAMREMDAMCFVLRDFTTGNYPYEKPEANVAKEFTDLQEELRFNDYAMLSNRLERLESNTRKPSKTSEKDKIELTFLQRLLGEFEGQGKDIRDIHMSVEEQQMIRAFQFASQKPRILLVNAAEGADEAQAAGKVKGAYCVFARIEEEIAGLSAEEKAEFLESYGLKQPFRDRLIKIGYDTQGLQSFFTVGEDEVRAWTIKVGDDAVTSAGRIHTDLARGFIRAEVIGYQDFHDAGNMREAKARNLLRLEAKDYVVKDGDILNIRFSV